MIAGDFIYMKYIGAMMLLAGAWLVESEITWLPWILVITGGILALKKGHAAGKSKHVQPK